MAKPIQGQVTRTWRELRPGARTELRALCEASTLNPANCWGSRQRRSSKTTNSRTAAGREAPTSLSPSFPAQGSWRPSRLPSCRPHDVQVAATAAAAHGLSSTSSGRSGPNFLFLAPAARGRGALPARVTDVNHAGLRCGSRQPRAAQKSRACQSSGRHWPVPGKGCVPGAGARVVLPLRRSASADARFLKVSFA